MVTIMPVEDWLSSAVRATASERKLKAGGLTHEALYRTLAALAMQATAFGDGLRRRARVQIPLGKS